MTIPPVTNLTAAFQQIHEPWSPRIAADVNDFQVKLAKGQGEFHWHHHDEEDELFLVHRGKLRIRFRDGEALVGEGEILVVPRGVEHLPVAESEICEIVVFEPRTTLNTGNLENESTIAEPPYLE